LQKIPGKRKHQNWRLVKPKMGTYIDIEEQYDSTENPGIT
jgi:hypothetical protein